MSKLQKITDLIFSKQFAYKFIAYTLFVGFLFIFRGFLLIIVLTFIFGYLFFSISKYFKNKIDLAFDKILNQRTKKILKKIFSLDIIIILVYLTFICLIVFLVSKIFPQFIFELKNLYKTFPFLEDYVNVNQITESLKEFVKFNDDVGNIFVQILDSKDAFSTFLSFFDKIKGYSIVIFKIMISLLLSFVFLIDRRNLLSYLGNIKNSNFSFLYTEYKIIFYKIIKSFGVIIKAQAIIAFINAILTTIGLFFIGVINGSPYPFLLTLTLVVFLAGFIPFLGVFISSVPILLFGFSTYADLGFFFVLEIFLLITTIHLIEAYYLNPKIVSKSLTLPISITLAVLIFSEKIFGMAGLILGISLFYFFIIIFGDIDKMITEKSKK